MKKLRALPNVVTAFGLACGLFVIFKVNMMEPGQGYFKAIFAATIVLMLAAFADFIDGALARVFSAESEFGSAFDSLADTVSFGVAPSVLLLKSLSLTQGSFLSFFAASSCMVYSLCGVLRLVRFSVQSTKEENLITMAEQKKHFTGLPITAGAASAVSLNLLFLSPFWQKIAPFSPTFRALIMSMAMVILGYLMVSPWKFPSLKKMQCKISSFPFALTMVFAAIGILYGVLYFFPLMLATLSWGYIVLALSLLLARKIAGKKSKTLQDFEPDECEYE